MGKGTNWTWYYSFLSTWNWRYFPIFRADWKKEVACSCDFLYWSELTDQICQSSSFNYYYCNGICIKKNKNPLSFSNNLCGQLVRTNGMHSWPQFLKLQSHVDIYILNVYKYEELFILLSCKWWASANQTALRRCGPLTWVCRLWPHKRIARLCFSFSV